MAAFITTRNSVEVNGQTILSFINGMGSFKQMFSQVLLENGINNPRLDVWYPQIAWLNSFKRIQDMTGPATLKIIGKNIPGNASWPEDIDNIDKALESLDTAYHMNHRGGEIGHYAYRKITQKLVQITCDNPYPCDFDMGLIEAVARKFASKGEIPRIQHEDIKTCRKNGDSECIYLVKW